MTQAPLARCEGDTDDTGLKIRIAAVADCVVALDGELDCETAPELGDVLKRLAGNGRRVVVDLSGLKFIDSSGLPILMSGIATEDGRRAVICPPGNVARVLSIVRAETVLAMYDDLDDAVDGRRG